MVGEQTILQGYGSMCDLRLLMPMCWCQCSDGLCKGQRWKQPAWDVVCSLADQERCCRHDLMFCGDDRDGCCWVQYGQQRRHHHKDKAGEGRQHYRQEGADSWRTRVFCHEVWSVF